ncbi:MAG TPA: hypothetical protein VIH90_08545 [Candidatus Saccharimonadales bacterium]
MSGIKLNERVLPTDRWSARIVSPVDISNDIDPVKYGPVVMFHPGWGKSPERYARLLYRMADSGILPIGIDTRYAYSDRQQPRSNILAQHKTVGTSNPYFKINGKVENRLEYRRSTVALDIQRRLGINGASQVGYSEGGRIAAQVAIETKDAPSLVIINGAGTGDSSHGFRRMARSNLNRITEMLKGNLDVPDLIGSSLGSTVYTLSHLRRTVGEKRVIQKADTWGMLDLFKDSVTSVAVLQATNDELISFEDSESASHSRQWVTFEPTPGTHSNIHNPYVQDLAIRAIQAA